MKWSSYLMMFLFLVNITFAQKDTSKTTPSTNSSPTVAPQKQEPSLPSLENFKPKISLGAGMLSFWGDLYSDHYQAPWTARIGYDLNISHRLNRYLQINFNVMFGKLGADENEPTRNENFESEIRCGGFNLLYDFGNFIPDNYKIRPWISAGVAGFEFLSKTDLFDKNGEKYNYWSDGSIKNMAEGSAGSQNAKDLVRDYVYETDIRERNADGFGKYQERSWAFPLGFGALMQITDRFDFKMGVQYYLTNTDYIDGITDKSLGNRVGNKSMDQFVYASFGLQYDLVFTKKDKTDTIPDSHYDGVDWLAIDNADYDKDGVKDWDDKCHGTPVGVKVDAFGCPLDDDKDGVPNYMDDENPSPKGFEVNLHGVALTDEFWQSWFDHYFDSLGLDKSTEVIGNAYAINPVKPKVVSPEQKMYTVNLATYKGGVPSDEMAYLLSIGDIKSTVLDDGTTVIYTSGSFDDVLKAVERRDEFFAEGNKKAKINYFKDEKLNDVTSEELEKLVKEAKAGGVKTNTVAANNTNPKNNVTTNENTFAKGDIVYRVQLGAYKNKISKAVFKNKGGVLELKTTDDYYRYVTNGCKTIKEAATLRADLVLMGYQDAFVTAYKDGHRIPMSATKATMATNEKEDLNENKVFNSIDKSLIHFKLQLGSLKKPGTESSMEERIKDLDVVDKQATSTGMIRYVTGNYSTKDAAEKARLELENKGFPEAFIIATFKNEIISIQEAMELLK